VRIGQSSLRARAYDDGTEFQPIVGSLELFTAVLAIDVTHLIG
jgi:hypothetical protein